MKDTITNSNNNYVHYLYKITNLLDNRYYIGIHSIDGEKTTPQTDNYWGSGTLIMAAIKEIGKEFFKKDIIFIGSSREDILKEEARLVSLETLKDPMNYNLALGGESFHKGRVPVYINDRSKVIFIPKKMAIENRLDVVDDDPSYVFCKETKTIIVTNDIKNLGDEYKLVKQVLSDQVKAQRDKFVNSMKGNVLAVKVGDVSRTPVVLDREDERLVSGEYTGFNKGQKLSESARRKKLGENNPSYGTVWITNGMENKRVNKKDLDLPKGWVVGRTPTEKELQTLTEANTQRREMSKVKVTIKNLNTDKEEEYKLDRIFLKRDELITAEYLQEIYETAGSWIKVANTLNICKESIRKIKNFYISLGYTFKTSTKIKRPGRHNVKTTLNKAMINNGEVMRYVDKNKVNSFLLNGWRLGKII